MVTLYGLDCQHPISGPLAFCSVVGISCTGPLEVVYELSPLQYFQFLLIVEKHPQGRQGGSVGMGACCQPDSLILYL